MTSPTLKRIGIPTALVAGGVAIGSLFAPIGLASAQESDADESTDSESSGSEASDSESSDDSDDSDDSGRRHRRGGRGFGAKAEVLEELLGLSASEIRDAMSEGGSLADVAEAQGVSSDDLTAALVASATDHIDEAVAEGKIDEDRAAELKDNLDERIDGMIERVPSEDGGRRSRANRARGGMLRAGSEAVQDILGLTAEEIQAAVADGQSLADLAEEQGVSTDDLVAALVAEATEQIDEAVAEGKIDEDRAAEAAEQLEEMIEQAVEADFSAMGRGRGGRGSRGGARFGGNTDDAGATVETGAEMLDA